GGDWGACGARDPETNGTSVVVEVRERGMFYSKALVLHDSAMTVEGLHSAIYSRFAADEYTPSFRLRSAIYNRFALDEYTSSFRGVRSQLHREWCRGALCLAYIYPVLSLQRDVLYGEVNLDSDVKVRQNLLN
ncbi:hypothetical protein T484DRAFT_1832747, partial [Baffinella frigidus]